MSRVFTFRIISVVFIACLGALVYSNSFHCSFHYDEIPYIVDNPFLKTLNDLGDIWKYYPCRFVTFLSFALNYRLNQLDVFGYHFFNLAVHIISACLVWWFVLLTLSTPAMKEDRISKDANIIALFAGLVFVSHPVQTEAVTYIWQRVASMATMFYSASLCFYVKSRLLQDADSCSVIARSEATKQSFKKIASLPTVARNDTLIKFYYICSLITAIAAMFTKEMTATLPLMILFYECCFLRTKKSLNWKNLAPFFLILLFISLIVLLLPKSLKAREMEGVISGVNSISPVHYLLTQFRVIMTYIRLLFVPIHQNLDYDYPVSNSLFEWPVLLSFLFIISILYGAKQLFLKYRLVSFSVFWFFLTLLPESSFIPLKDVIFEHRLYLPLTGYSIFLVSGVYYLLGKKDLKAMIIVLTVVIGFNSVLTYQRNKIWKNEITLWNDTVQKSPHKARPYNNLGIAYAKDGDYAQAIVDFNKAVLLDPQHTEAYNNLGHAYFIKGDYDQAILNYKRSIEIKTADEDAYRNLDLIYAKQGRATGKPMPAGDRADRRDSNPKLMKFYYDRGSSYVKQGDYAKAIADFNKAIALDPGHAEVFNNRGNAYNEQGDLAQAMADYNKAIEINPNFAEGYYDRGLVNVKKGRIDQAIVDYNRTIKIDPKLPEAYYVRGTAYAYQGKFTQAMADYNKAIDLKPNYAEAYNNRGIVFDKQGSSIQALSDYNKAIKIDPGLADAYNNRGLSYYKEGGSDRAIIDFNKAIEINPRFADAYINRGNAYAKQNNFTQAISDYTKTIAINPKYVLAYTNRTILYYQLKEYDKAWDDVHTMKKLGAAVNPDLINLLKQVSGRGD